MTVNVCPLHHYYRPAHLTHVIAEMQRRGAPRIKATWDHVSDTWYAHEGTHRLRAAKTLGLAPVIRPVPWRKTKAAMGRARIAALRNAHTFDAVIIEAEE